MKKAFINISILSFISLWISCQPHNAEYYTDKGAKKVWKKDQKKGEEYLLKAITLDSNYCRAYYHLGESYRRKWINNQSNPHYLDTTRSFYLKAISKNDSASLYWFMLGHTYENEGIKRKTDVKVYDPEKLQMAINYFNVAIQIDSTRSTYYMERGACYSALGDTLRAWSDLKRACELQHSIACLIISWKK